MKYKNGDEIEQGDVIRWTCRGYTDRLVIYSMTGIYQGDKILYLGGGIDDGVAFGMKLDTKEVITQAFDNDGSGIGFEKVGTAMDIVRLISNFKGGDES